ncbi:hypothetical protein [Alteromonas sp. 14N.309.X.WAT.G.H12]|uniref:hypothetical protein n=1 Tax=Alteromonas sp. 14N.309.X.WAT.G.H12 TaxID=3120824 RepID=UPI002FD13057
MQKKLFEFGDLFWVPEFYHAFLRRFMGALYKLMGYHKLWLPELKAFISKAGGTVLDPCAGSGYVNELLVKEMDNDGVKFYLSDFMIDKNPEFREHINNLGDDRIHYLDQPIDVLKDNPDFQIPKIFINSFHHFDDEQVAEILRLNLSHGNDILVLEYCDNSVVSYISMLFGPLLAMILLPFITERRQLLVTAIFTYLIPIVPLMLLWDGLVSNLRCYSHRSLKKIVHDTGFTNSTVTTTFRRSWLYPAGVTAHHITASSLESE